MNQKIKSIVAECKALKLIFNESFFVVICKGQLVVNELVNITTDLINNLPDDLKINSVKYNDIIDCTIAEIKCYKKIK